MILHSYDPGGTTGFAILETTTYEILDAGDFPNMQEVGHTRNMCCELVIIEAFRLYPWKANAKKWSSFPEVEVIGALKYWCMKYGIPWIEQGADTKALFSDDKLKALGLWNKYSRHARDAIRHALYWQTVGGDNHWLNLL